MSLLNTKRKKHLADRNADFMKICTTALTKEVEVREYDAIGINVGSKLKKMDENQRIYAELLINKTLRGRGLLKSLTPHTNLTENRPYYQNIPITYPVNTN